MLRTRPHIHDLFTPEDLTAAVTAKLVNIREGDHGLDILNYSDTAMWTPGAWDNPAVRQCRGLIVRSDDGEIVARPWAKFFNHGQPEAGELDLDAPVEVTDKLDGSLGILYHAPDGPAVATRGSFTSDQAVHATKVLRKRYPDIEWDSVFTPLVEIIYPENRIVCDYGNFDDLVLLGAVCVTDGTYLGPRTIGIGWPGPLTETFAYSTLREALAAAPRPGKEGLCVRYLDEPRIVKIKQDDYVRLHRIVTGLSEKSVWQGMVDGQGIDDLLAGIPDELHPWVTKVQGDLAVQVEAIGGVSEVMHNAIRLALGRDYERREYADLAKRHPKIRPYLFNLLDGRDPRPAILKSLRPVGDTRAKPISEDVA